MLAAFNARHPGLYVSVTVGNSRDTLRDLLDYRTDVAVLAHVDPDPRLVAIPYRRHRVIAFCPVDHPFAQRRSIRARDMEGQRLVVPRGGGRRRAAPSTRRCATPTSGPASSWRSAVVNRSATAVAKGIGMGVVSEAEFIPDPRIRPLPIADAEIYTYAHVVHLKERQKARLVHAFLQVLAGLLPVSSPSSRRRPSGSRR